jgi:subtilase family serine protease
VTKVEFYDGATLIAQDTSSPYSISWNTTAVANGAHTLTAKAYDAAGNVGTSSQITVTVSNKPDLVVTDIKFYNSSGQEVTTILVNQAVTAKAFLKNQGQASTVNTFGVQWYFNGVSIPMHTLAALGAGQSSTDSFIWSCGAVGTITIKCAADTANSIVETDEGNNSFSKSVVVNVP